MIQNILTFCVKNDLTFVEGSIPSGKLVANDINRNSIYLITPYDESIVKANFQTNLQSDTPTSVLGILVNGKISVDEIVDTTASYYNLVKDWNIYEFKVPSTTLSFISRNRTGKIGINFSIEQRLVPTIKDSYGEYQGEILSQGQSLTESGYYINKTIEFELDTGEDVFIYNLNDILVLTKRESPLEDIQVKISAYSNRGSTPTTLYSVDPSLLNDNFETIKPGLTQQIVQQVNDHTGDIVLLFQNIGVNNATLVDLENRISVAEQDIDTAEANITNLQGRMTTAESDIDNIEDGTTIVEKALRDSLGNIIKDSYVSSVYPTYNDTTDKLFIETYDVRDGLLANNEVILPKATTTKNGLLAKEDKAYVDGLPNALLLKENKSEKNQANGYAGLDSSGKVPSTQLPSYVDDILEFANLASFPATGESGIIYVALDTNLTYRWSGSAYVEISPSLALGETAETAYRGDRGKTAYDHSQLVSGNPHQVTKSDVGLGNVDNTSDVNKPVSTAQQAAIDELFNVGKNKLNPNKLINGYYNVEGTFVSSSSYKSAFIAVKNVDVLRASQALRFASFFDTEKSFVSNYGQNISSGTTLTASADGYIVVSIDIYFVPNTVITLNEALPENYVAYKRIYKNIEVDGESVKDNSLPANKASFLEQTDNLFDYRTKKDNTFTNLSGEESSNSSYHTSDYIPIKSGYTYTFSGNVRAVVGYNNAKVASGNYLGQNTNVVSVTSDGYMKVDLFADTYSDNFMIFCRETENIFDPDEVKVNTYVMDTGEETSNSNYNCSGMIPVKKNRIYVFSSEVRSVVNYDTLGVAAGAYYGQNCSSILATRDGYIVLNLSSSINTSTFKVIESQGFDNGFVHYGYYLGEYVFPKPDKETKIVVSKSGKSFSVSTLLKDGTPQTDNCILEAKNNNVFNFFSQTVSVLGVNRLKSADDDIAPFRIQNTTVGANHGWTAYWEMDNTDKTTADIGSQWKDEEDNIFTLCKVLDGKIAFLGETTNYGPVDGPIVPKYISPSGDTLTHYSGATHTNSISVSNLEQKQLYPSVCRKTVSLTADGLDITSKDGIFSCNEVNVFETYDIADYYSLLTYLQTHIGKAFDVNAIDGCARIINNYKFIGEGKCVVSTTLMSLKKIRLNYSGIVQAQAMGGQSGNKLFYYIGNVAEKDGLNFSTKVATTSITDTVEVGEASNRLSADIPPNKIVTLACDNSNNRLWGFALGYIIDKSLSSNANRIAHNNASMEIRGGTLKMYPRIYTNYDSSQSYPSIMPAGIVWNGLAYRVCFGPDTNPKATAIYDIKIGNDYYVFIDYNKVAYNESYKLEECIGCEIEVLQSNNEFQLLSNIVDADGIHFNINGTYGWAVLKVHK